MPNSLHPQADAPRHVGGAPAPIFRRVLTDGEDERAWRDATALVAALVADGEGVTRGEAADLIVLGSAAGAPTGRVTLDEAGRPLLEAARCPVAITPRGFAEREERGLRQIDVGIDGSREATAALALAARIAESHGARLRAIAVAEPSFDLAGTPRPIDSTERERLARHLEHAAEGLPGLWVATELQEGLADQILLGLAREADLLVIGSRASYGNAGRASVGDTGERILRASPTPVLLVPAP